jgi:hypothetical protein
MKTTLSNNIFAVAFFFLFSATAHAGRDACNFAKAEGILNDNSARVLWGNLGTRTLFNIETCHPKPRNVRVHLLCKGSNKRAWKGIRVLPMDPKFYDSSAKEIALPVPWTGRSPTTSLSFQLDKESSAQKYKISFYCPTFD